MELDALRTLVIGALEDLKAVEIKEMDVHAISGFTDLMVVATGNSTRQVKALADRVQQRALEAGVKPLGVEGERDAEWILIDFGDMVIHVMTAEKRDFYNLEKLWSTAPARAGAGKGDGGA